jgi:hypothetical protein
VQGPGGRQRGAGREAVDLVAVPVAVDHDPQLRQRAALGISLALACDVVSRFGCAADVPARPLVHAAVVADAIDAVRPFFRPRFRFCCLDEFH